MGATSNPLKPISMVKVMITIPVARGVVLLLRKVRKASEPQTRCFLEIRGEAKLASPFFFKSVSVPIQPEPLSRPVGDWRHTSI